MKILKSLGGCTPCHQNKVHSSTISLTSHYPGDQAWIVSTLVICFLFQQIPSSDRIHFPALFENKRAAFPGKCVAEVIRVVNINRVPAQLSRNKISVTPVLTFSCQLWTFALTDLSLLKSAIFVVYRVQTNKKRC